ncbi:M56 family metallopeptidase [Steroidobacter sp. S1-65]|uniref:M56 family metallopeptidase n=1 Tax=Steroidobacter gossypii TaxID=2805490 RepID=A0ABS1WUV4_9GAMM|nr:M56 family metallopeptidase [Steroidobacter gossypii]MBM0104744.1 M56 family metallopeptidase [Steroidobacter gossypii]
MLKWMLYATLVAALAGLAAVAWERAASLGRFPSRWAWVAAMALSVSIPLIQTFAPVPVSERILEVVGAPAVTNFDAMGSSGVSIQAPLIQNVGTQAIDQWLGALWLCLSAAASIMFALGLHAVRREQRLGEVTVVAGHQVVITESIGPAVVGLMNPVILVPGWIRQMSARQREMVIAHELQHVRAKDQWLIGAAIGVLIVFPWNLALWWHLKKLRLAIELDCDRRVLRTRFEAGEYGQVLVDAASLGAHDRVVVPALIESASSLEKRIRSMLRSRGAHDKPLTALLALASMAICASAAALDPPAGRPWTPHRTAGSVDGVPRVLSPQKELELQWQSLVEVLAHFEPGMLNTDRSKTPFVFIAADKDGRVVRHHLEFRPAWQDNPIPSDELQNMFVELLGQPAATTPLFLQLSLASMRFGPNPAMVILGVNPGATALDAAAPAIDLSAIQRDRRWLEPLLIDKTNNERLMIERADPAALNVGLAKGTELWIALSAEGQFVRGGRRNIIADPNESRHFVENALPGAHIGDIARGTAVRDAKGNRVTVAWHWLQQ